MTLQSDTKLEAIPEPRVGDLTSEGKRTATALCVGVQGHSVYCQTTPLTKGPWADTQNKARSAHCTDRHRMNQPVLWRLKPITWLSSVDAL